MTGIRSWVLVSVVRMVLPALVCLVRVVRVVCSFGLVSLLLLVNVAGALTWCFWLRPVLAIVGRCGRWR